MRCRSILNTLFYSFALVLYAFATSAGAADFTVIPLENTSDIAVYEVIGDYDAEFPDGTNNAISRQEIAREFYKTHPDDYDFLVIFSDFDFRMPESEAIAFYQRVKNDVQGIGKELVDNTSLYGSNGVLQGTIDMGNIKSMVYDPLDPGFSDTLGILSHELLHRWAAKVTFRRDDGSISNDLLGIGGYHWSFLLDTAGSLEYGNQWVDNGNGTFTSLAGRRYFSPLDLYLMGLIDKSEVPPMLLIDNPEIDPDRLTEPGITIEGNPQYISIDDIIAAEGERIPSAADAQKNFRVGCLFITRPGTYQESDLYGIRNIMQSWSMWFSGLTNGIGKVVIDNAPLPDLPENPGPVISPIDPRTAPPEINEGIAWLLNNQEEEGNWEDSLFTTERDTPTVLNTLAGYETAADSIAQGLSWLENTDEQNLDHLARKIDIFSRSGFDVSVLTAQLLDMQNQDGGWGSSRNYHSSPADTAMALHALSSAGVGSNSEFGPAISYLLSEQNPDSGWGTEGRSNILTSADVISAFLPFKSQYQLDIPIQNALTWIYSKQNTDGGFGNSPSTIYSTAKTLIALKQMGITSQVTDQALSYILDGQGQDGSWLSSPYQTALAVSSIWVAAREPDLSVSTAEIVPSPDTVTSLPSDISLSITVHNAGMSDVSDVKVVLYEGAVSDEGMIGEASVAVSGQSSETVFFNATITNGKPHQYYVVIDPDNLIKESSEQNNTALRIVYPETTYDFEILQQNVAISPAVGSIYEPLAITAKVTNKGTVDGLNVPLHLVVDNGTGPVIVATQTLDLPAGQTVDANIEWIPEISGTGLTLSVIVDPHDGFAETLEDNNSVSLAVNINGSTKPDLSLTYSDVSFTPAPALEGGSALLKAEILNRGFSPAADVRVDFYDGVPGESGSVHLGTVTVPAIAPGESVEAALDWANIAVSGTRVISVVIDPDNVVDEIKEDNNSAFNQLQILSIPDFTVSDTSISFSPEAPKEGDIVVISAIVQNKGEQPGLNVPVAFYDGGALIGNAIIPDIGANGQASASVTFDTTGKVGIRRIEVKVDPESTLLEQDRSNNRAVRSVGIQNSSLWLSNNYISPNGDGVKDNTNFGYRLAVPQDVTVVIMNDEGEAVREFTGPEFTNTSYVSLTWDGLDNKGRVVDDGQYRIQVMTEGGSILSSLLVTVDNNRSSLLDALGTPYLFTTKVQLLLSNYKYNWLSDDSGVVFHLDKSMSGAPEYNTGLYFVSPTSGGVSRLVPEEWSETADPGIGYRYLSNASDCNSSWQIVECDQVNPGFALSRDGHTIAFILEKYDKITREVLQQQLWTVNKYGDNLTLLDSYNYQAGDHHQITDIFPSPVGSHIAYKLYDQNADHNFFTIIDTDGTVRSTYEPGWNNGLDDYHRLTWSPDGKKLVFSNATHAVVADLTGNLLEVLPIQNPIVFFDWYGSDRILVRSLTSSWGEIESWTVDLNALDSPLLISENLETWSGWYYYGGCLRDENGSIATKPPLHENGDFIAGYRWGDSVDYYFITFTVCNISGGCQEFDMMLDAVWADLSLTPDTGNAVFLNSDSVLETFDRESNASDVFLFGFSDFYRCEDVSMEYWKDKYPSHYTIWPPTDRDCAEGSTITAQKWNWFDNETFLAYYFGDEDYLITFNIENGERKFLFEDSYFDHYPYRLDLSPNKRYLSFLDGNDFTVLGSLLNLTADLRPSKTESAVNLNGIAADLNFKSWKLEYADRDTLDDWRSITPPNENPVVNGLLATWIPPYEGSFLVRLTVTDKAGNEVWDRKIVTWGKEFSVTNIYKTGETFSPNDDGIKDTVGLNYFVHEPIHLELFVHDMDGKLIRTFSQDHASPGEHAIVWDGRDEFGGIVPDGYYTIRIFDYEFFFQVDTTPPYAMLEFQPVICGGTRQTSELSSQLLGLAHDENLKYWTVYYRDINNPQEWHPFKSGETVLQTIESGNPVPRFIQGFTPDSSLPIGFLGSTSFRIVVEDFAGNKSVIAAQMNEELPVLYSWDGSTVSFEKNEAGVCETPKLLPIESLAPGFHTLTLVETIREPIVSAILQYRMHMQWYDAEENGDPPDGEVEFTFDTSSLVPEEVAAVRVKLLDETGIEYYSNSLQFNPPVFSASMGCIPIGSLSPALISMNVSLPESLETLQFQATDKTFGIEEWVDFATYNVFDGFPYQFGAPFPESLPEGQAYPIRFVGIGESGKEYTSDVLSPPYECQAPKPKPPPLPGGVCIETELLISYSGAKAPCNSVNYGSATVSVEYCPNDGPKVLPEKVKYYLVENGISRLLKEFDLAVDGWGEVTFETAGIAEGEHSVRVDLVYADSVIEGFREKDLIIDRTLPTANITYPSLSTPFCARVEVDGDGTVSRYASIEGIATDINDIHRYSIVNGQGSNPNQWYNLNNGIPCSPEEGDCSYLGTGNKIGKLGEWDVTNIEPVEHSLQLMVTDTYGNTSCYVTQAVVDTSMSLTATADRTIISPNGDGIKDEVTVDYQVGEYAVVDITVLQDDSVIRALVTGLEIANSSDTISWDGLNDAGTTVSDGSYLIHVEARDACGNLLKKKFPVTIDNTPPTAMILYPGTGDPLNVVTEVRGTATDEHLEFYQLHVRDEASSDEPLLLSEGLVFVENDILGTWNTFDLAGNWAIVLNAVDQAGNTKTTQLPVSFGTREALISKLEADPKLFSPNNDGKLDSTTITYELTDAANIIIIIEDILGNTILTGSSTGAVAGSHEYQWSGMDAGGSKVLDGDYKFKVKAESVNPPFTIQVESITVITDTVSPTIGVTAPVDSSYHPGVVDVQGSLNDLNLKEYAVSLSGGQEANLIDTAAVSSEIVFSDSLDLPEGSYAIQVYAKDGVENASNQTVSFTVDKTRPKILLESPIEGEFFGSTQPVVSINGIIEETNLQSYTVQYGAGENPVNWVEIATGESQPLDNVLASWNVGNDQGITDGDYTIRVTAIDKAGWESTAQVAIHVDNNSPELTIINPSEGIYVKDVFDVSGTISDPFLKKYTLDIADSNCSTAENWSVLRTGTQSIQSSIISSIKALPTDGEYCIRLSGSDNLENTAETMVSFTIDTTPPAPPLLSGNLDEGTGVSLAWHGNTESDLVGYDLYRNGEKLNSVPITATQYLDQNLEQGEYTYIVRAIDLAGWESKDSNQVVFTVDITPPDAAINSPRNDDLVSNYFDIKGRAYSTDDFKEYRVSYGAGENPQTWHLLRKSPVPVSSGTLVRWDVITLEYGPYTIRLEAEDLNGNISEKIVSITVDNTPPAAPVLLTATPEGAIVDLTWQANSEPDFAGYLVYRGGQLANESGTVIGDLSPYLIDGLAFQNIDVPDGTHDYYLVAMDHAGNMSDQSNSIQVSIDTHAPHLNIVSPQAGHAFDKPLSVRAESEDTDINTVQFQYQVNGAGSWVDFGSVLTQRPYVVIFDPAALGHEFGSYRLRAVATDQGGLVDETPEELLVHFRDATPPAAPNGFTGHANGGKVELSWNPNQEADLAGYNLYRDTLKLNTAPLTETSYTDPPGSSGLSNGEYEYSVTAVDTSENESEKAPTTAIVFTPLLNFPQSPVTISNITVDGSTVPEATVEIYRDQASGDVSLGTTTADGVGQYSLVVNLAGGTNSLYAIATDIHGNISRPSYTRNVFYDAPPAAPTVLVAEVINNDVSLSWNANTETDLAGYNIYRSVGTEWQKINPAPVALISYVDSGLKNGTYTYRVTAVDTAESESGPSNEISAVVEQPLPAPPTNLTAMAAPEGRAVDVCWDASADPVDGYQVYHSEIAGGHYTQVINKLITNTCYRDIGLTDGTEYFYVARAIDSYGNTSGNSNEDSAIPQDNVTPEKPLILLPTISGKPFQSQTGIVDVIGVTEPGAAVDLIHDDVLIDTVEAVSVFEHETFTISGLSIYETAVVPDGSKVFYSQAVSTPTPYSYDYYTFRKDLETGVETRVDQIPMGSWEHHISPDGNKLIYQFDDEAEWYRIGIYDIATGTTQPLTTASEVDEYEPSWSKDSTKVVFDSDRGEGFYDIWMHDLTSGETIRVTQNINGYYPEISHDNNLIAFQTWDSVNRKLNLNLVDSTGGDPILLEEDVDWSGYYPSIEWAPMSGKLAFTANRDGQYDIYIYDTETGETSRLTQRSDTEIDLQWSPDGKQIAYHTYNNGVTEVYVSSAENGEEVQLLDTFAGAIEMDFNWLPSGIFYRVDSDLHRIIPPGTFIFEDVGLHPGQNVFTARAEDAAGHVSEPADEIQVNIDTEAMPDLEVLEEDIYILPGALLAGDEAILGAVVRNNSSVPVENVYAEIYIWDANDNIELIHSETISYIGQQSEEWFSVNWDSTEMMGANEVFVLLDTYNEITESREDNNVASSGFYVAEDEGVIFETTLNGKEFRSDEVVAVNVDIYNSGHEKDVRLTVIIEDENGVPVEELVDMDKTLSYGANERVELSWNASSVFAGIYQVRTALVDTAAGLIGETVKPFTVSPDIGVSTVLTTNKVEYGPDENVLLDLSVANQGANLILPELKVKLTVSDSTIVHFVEEHTLVNLFPLDSASINTFWNTARNVPGSYTAAVEVLQDNTLIAESSTEFVILPVMEISGNVSVDPKAIFQDGGVDVGYSIASSGNVEEGTLLFKLIVLDARNSTVVSALEESITLGADEVVSGQRAFAGIAWDIGVYTVLLQSFRQDEIENLDSDSFTVIDGVAPVVSVQSPADGSVLSNTFDLSVIATDNASGVAEVEYQIDNGSWLPLPLVNPATGRYAVGWLPDETDEGSHMVRFRASDNGGNESIPVEHSIVIQPKVDMTTATGKTSYSMNENVGVSVDLTNIAWQKNVNLAVQVETQAGSVVSQLTDEDLVLGADEVRSLQYNWQTGSADAGNYNVRAKVTKNGTVLSENHDPFVIEKVFVLNGTLALPDTSVPLGDPATAEWTATNSGNFNVDGLNIENILTDQNLTQLQQWTETISLPKGQAVSGSFLVQTQGIPLGSYLLTLKARHESEVVDLAVTQFELVDITPPDITIISPADGTLVDGPLEVAVSATDDAAGVDSVEFQIDQRGWQPLAPTDPSANIYTALWTPVETDEGSRIISFRGSDKSGNNSEPVTVGFNVELCKSFEEMTGSLTITPGPIYYSQDVAIGYTLTNQCNKTLARLNVRVVVQDPVTGEIVYDTSATSDIAPGATSVGNFALSSLDLNVQQYHVLLEISLAGKAPRIIAQSGVEILSAVETEINPLDQVNLLVWLNNAQSSCGDDDCDDDDCGDDDCDDDDCDDDDCDDDDCDDDDCDDDDCDEDDCDDDDDDEHDSYDDEESYYPPQTCEERCTSYNRIESILTQLTDNFTIVCSRDEFGLELRNPIYTDIMIIGNSSSTYDDSGAGIEELREKVYSGTGLVSFGWNVPGDHQHNDDDDEEDDDDDDNGYSNYMESFLGVTAKGVLSVVDPEITLEESPISNIGKLKIDGQLVHVESARDTEVVGWFINECRRDDDDEHHDDDYHPDDDDEHHDDDYHPDDDDDDDDESYGAYGRCEYPAIVLNEYGQGQTVYSAFDLCEAFNDVNDDQLTNLIINAVGFVHNQDDRSELVPHQFSAFALEFTSPGLDFDLRVSATCPEEIILFDPTLGDWVAEYPWSVTFPVQADATTALPYYVLAPDQKGVFGCEFSTWFGDGSQYTLLQKNMYEFTVNKDRASRLEEAIGAINNLQVTWYERYKRNSVLYYLQKVLDRTVTNREHTELNILDIKEAVGSLLYIKSVDINDIRLQLDTLLRIEQGRFYLYD